jgi:enhancing lycopene biosynthesis protein 2
MKDIAVILSGCGRADGSEIHESVCTLLALSGAGVPYRIFAPDMEQKQVTDHLRGVNTDARRNVLTEAARIARGNITALSELDTERVSALIFPGGKGAVLNLCTYDPDGRDCRVQPAVERVLSAAMTQKKPLGFICIAPVLGARVARDLGIALTLTAGTDRSVAADIEAMGCTHRDSDVRDCVTDSENRVVSTAAYMSATSVAEACAGIRALVREVIRLVKEIA